MKRYQVEVREILSTIVIVEAESEEQAIEETITMYKNEEIVLSEADFLDVEFNIKKGTIGHCEFN